MNDKCPHCNVRLHPLNVEQTDMGTKVNFVCENGACSDSIGKTFFAYTESLQH